ncbi:UNVERIFIED_CONTAM: tRNA-specific 2-thiouridylase MnmA [Sesamum latifolium]|uniref:tRNA-5-taurinomethyluridine 2-sulfurtransferase n=1 Tax=Sesamum latifolium TaxID=2727402 RepID=A0AAW2Y625_9LAMI
MPLRLTVMPTLSLYLHPKPLLRRKTPRTAVAITRFLSLSAATCQRRLVSLRPLSSLSSAAVESESSSISSTSQNPKSIDPRYLSCSLPEKKPLKVAVLLSGGVDSSVALRLLHAAGHSCTAFYLKIWFQEDFENYWSECPWEEDLKYAKAVCDQVDVPLEVVHLTDEYWNNVVSYIIDEYRYGRTPNPDVLCNTRIKFGAFVDAISGMKFDFIASGHYAKVVHPDSGNKDEPSTLELSKDMVKDQTYFLSHLSQSQLKGLIFPLGCIQKKSRTWNYLTKIGRIHKYVFLERYVVEKDVKNNVVFVSRNYFSVDKRRRIFRVGSLRWFNGSPPREICQLQCKVRHGPVFYHCDVAIEVNGNGHEIAVVKLSEDDQGLAAGQFAAFYQESTCIGSGVILESWDDQGFPVCARALETARMEDKSKLGKPVKIKVIAPRVGTRSLIRTEG